MRRKRNQVVGAVLSLVLAFGLTPGMSMNVVASETSGGQESTTHTHAYNYYLNKETRATINALCEGEGCNLSEVSLEIKSPKLETYTKDVQTGDEKATIEIRHDQSVVEEDQLPNEFKNIEIRYFKAKKKENSSGQEQGGDQDPVEQDTGGNPTSGGDMGTTGVADTDLDPKYVRDGAKLAAAPTNAGLYWAEFTLGEESQNVEEEANAVTAHVVYEIKKATINVDAPTGLKAVYGQTLADVALTNPGTNIDGTWAWVEAETTKVGSAGNKKFEVKFTPDDTVNYDYNPETPFEVSIAVSKADATIVTTPAANPLKYKVDENGVPVQQYLVTTGNAENGTIKYAIGDSAETAPTEAGVWQDTAPKEAAAGTYYVWYKVVGAENYNDVEPKCITVEIKVENKVKAEATFTPNNKVSEVKEVTIDEAQLIKEAEADKTPIADNQKKDVTVKMVAKPVEEKDAPKAAATAIKEAAAANIPSADKDSLKVTFLDIVVSKTVDIYKVDNGIVAGTPEKKEDSVLTSLSNVIDIPVEYDMTGKFNLRIARYHGDKVEMFTKLSAKPATTALKDLTYFVEGTGKDAIVHIYTKEFSTYALFTSGTEEYKAEADSVTVYRLYYAATREHFYTTGKTEREVLINKYGWIDEGVAWKSPREPKTDAEKETIKPVYRLYNAFTTDHHYTDSLNEKNTLVRLYGWVDEGVAFYCNTKGDATVYRLWKAGLKTGAHHFTTSKNEYDTLITRGWVGETEAFKVNAAE